MVPPAPRLLPEVGVVDEHVVHVASIVKACIARKEPQHARTFPHLELAIEHVEGVLTFLGLEIANPA